MIVKRFIKSFILLLVSFYFLFNIMVNAELLPEEEALINVFEKASPSVAFIKNAALTLDWYSASVYEIPKGAGSGFVWDDQGHIVTNFHVIYEASSIEVILENQKSFAAEVIGVSPDHDLAVLKIEAPKEILKAIMIGSSSDLKVGQKAVSIGNPFGLDYSLSVGVVSALGRSIKSLTGSKIHDVIQTDAAINPGNSGGPLLDSSGKLIGVSTAIYSPSGASAGVGFAIPVDVVKRVVPQLIKYGKVQKVGLGIVLVPDRIREHLGFEGAMILDILRSSAAEQAGLHKTKRDSYGRVSYGDIIITIDGVAIKNNEELTSFLDKKNEGDLIEIQFLRNNKKFGTKATLQLLKE